MALFQVGYFDVDGKIVAVKGEAECLDTAREDNEFPNQVFWSKEALLTAREDRRRIDEENELLAEWHEAQRQAQLAQARELRAANGG